MFTLASRLGLTVVDGAPVTAAAVTFNEQPVFVSGAFIVTVTGAPTTYNVRAAVEVSPDGGTTWHQVIRFADITNAAPANRFARTAGLSVGAEVAVAASALGSAQASPGVVVDTPWPVNIRAVTQFQALTGGTSPTVTLGVYLELGGD